MPSNAEIFAAWLLHAHRNGPSGPMIPGNEKDLLEIIDKKPENWFMALAIGEAFCKQIRTEEPKSIQDTGEALVTAMKGVHNLSKQFGNVLSAPPARGLRR